MSVLLLHSLVILEVIFLVRMVKFKMVPRIGSGSWENRPCYYLSGSSPVQYRSRDIVSVFPFLFMIELVLTVLFSIGLHFLLFFEPPISRKA